MARFDDLGGSTKGSPEEVAKGNLQGFAICFTNLQPIKFSGSYIITVKICSHVKCNLYHSASG